MSAPSSRRSRSSDLGPADQAGRHDGRGTRGDRIARSRLRAADRGTPAKLGQEQPQQRHASLERRSVETGRREGFRKARAEPARQVEARFQRPAGASGSHPAAGRDARRGRRPFPGRPRALRRQVAERSRLQGSVQAAGPRPSAAAEDPCRRASRAFMPVPELRKDREGRISGRCRRAGPVRKAHGGLRRLSGGIQLVPPARLADILADLLDARVSQAALPAMIRRTAGKFRDPASSIREALPKPPRASGRDGPAGRRQAPSGRAFCNALPFVLRIDPSRGAVPEDCLGTVARDHFAAHSAG